MELEISRFLSDPKFREKSLASLDKVGAFLKSHGHYDAAIAYSRAKKTLLAMAEDLS